MSDEKSAIKDIELIKKMIAESQDLLPFRSEHLILWGIIVPLSTVGTFLLDLYSLEKFIWVVWAIPCSIGGFLSYYIGNKLTGSHKTTMSTVYGMLWVGLLLSITIIVTALFVGLIPLNIVLAFMSILLGLCYFTTSFLHRLKSIKVISILWYCLSIVLLFVRNENAGYIMGISSLFLNLIPGLILRRRK